MQTRSISRAAMALAALLAIGLWSLPADAAPTQSPPVPKSHFAKMALLNFGSLAAVVSFAIFAIRRRERWSMEEWTTRHAATEASDAAEAQVGEELARAPEVLRCARCAAPVALDIAATAACQSCGAAVEVPPAYVALFQARAAAAQALTRDVAELRRVEILTHPLWAPAWVLAALALGWGLVRLNELSNVAADDSLIGLLGAQWLALLIVPVGMLISGAGQLGAWSELGEVKTSFAAGRDDKQRWTCRRCAAPLQSQDGVSAVCTYCGAQNLLRATAEREASAEQKRVHALAAQVKHARAVMWHWFWSGIQVPSFLLAAIGGLLFLSFGCLAMVMLLGG